MQKNKLKLAIIGCGAIFQNNHLPALTGSADWQISFLVDNDLARVKKFAEKTGSGYSDKLADIPSDIDACLIATPNFLHAVQSIELLNRGFHIICEKPIALHMSEAEEMKLCAQKNQKHFFMVHQKRFQQNFMYLRKNFLKAGDIKYIDLSLGNKFGWISRTNFYHSPEKAGGGVFIDLGVHLLDILVSISNDIDIHEIIFNAPFKSDPVIDTAATCFGMLDHTIPFTLRVSRLTGLNNSVKIGLEDAEWEFSLNDPNGLSVYSTHNTEEKKIDFSVGDMLDPFSLYWCNVAAVINGTVPDTMPSTIDDGLAVMRCIEKSRELGQLITI